jgi:hypothetical protein
MADREQWELGYLTAVANLARMYDEPAIAVDLLREIGITSHADLLRSTKRAGMDEQDATRFARELSNEWRKP